MHTPRPPCVREAVSEADWRVVAQLYNTTLFQESKFQIINYSMRSRAADIASIRQNPNSTP